MKVRIDVHFMDFESGKMREPTSEVEVKDSLGEDWISRGWAIKLDDEPKKAVIETPEDEIESSKRETATVRRKAQQ